MNTLNTKLLRTLLLTASALACPTPLTLHLCGLCGLAAKGLLHLHLHAHTYESSQKLNL